MLILRTLVLATWPSIVGAQAVDQMTWITNGKVNALLRSENTIYLGGKFTYVGPHTGSGAVLDLSTDTIAAPLPRVSGVIHAVAPDGTGGWYVGGFFDAIGGIERSNLAHILADRTVSPWNPNADYGVYALEVSGETVYAGGVFSTIGGETRSYIAAIDAKTGAPTSWNADVWGAPIFDIEVSGSTVYVGGNFATIHGEVRNRIAAIDAVSGLPTSWNPNANESIGDLIIDGETIYAAGSFTNIGGENRQYLAALDAKTGVAAAWNAHSNGVVRAIGTAGKTIYTGGQFTSIGDETRNGIAALDSETGFATAWDPSVDGQVYTLEVSGSTVYVGGDFTSIGGETRYSIAALDANTGLATKWNPDSDGTLYALAVSGETVYAGGTFSSIGGERRNNIAAFDASTGAVTNWDPNATGGDTEIHSLAMSQDKIYLGGVFSHIGNEERRNIAAVNVSTGAAAAWNPTASFRVYAMAVAGATLYAGGFFENVAGEIRNFICSLDATTGALTDWDPNANFVVKSLTVSGSTVYAGGEFTNIGGMERNHIAALDAETGAATDWNPNASGGAIPTSVNALIVNGPIVYAGGEFTSIGGANRNRLASLDITTGAATDWNPNANSVVKALMLSGSRMYVGGDFTRIAHEDRNCLAAFDVLAGAITNWNPYASGGYFPGVNALAMSGTTVYAGGEFITVRGQSKPYFAALSTTSFMSRSTETAGIEETNANLRASTLSFTGVVNPVRERTVLEFSLSEAGFVSLEIYDVQGRRVATLVDHKDLPAGSHDAVLDARSLTTGVYFARLASGSEHSTQKIVVLR